MNGRENRRPSPGPRGARPQPWASGGRGLSPGGALQLSRGVGAAPGVAPGLPCVRASGGSLSSASRTWRENCSHAQGHSHGSAQSCPSVPTAVKQHGVVGRPTAGTGPRPLPASQARPVQLWHPGRLKAGPTPGLTPRACAERADQQGQGGRQRWPAGGGGRGWRKAGLRARGGGRAERVLRRHCGGGCSSVNLWGGNPLNCRQVRKKLS